MGRAMVVAPLSRGGGGPPREGVVCGVKSIMCHKSLATI